MNDHENRDAAAPTGGSGSDAEARLKKSGSRRKRRSFRKMTGKLHLWLGLASGLIVFIVAITGCLYAFEKEIKELVYRDRLFVPEESLKPAASPLPLTALWDSAQKALGPGHPVQRAEIHAGSDRAWIFSSTEYRDGALTWYGEQAHDFKVYVNPYDGSVLKVENTKFEFFNLVVWAHWSLLLSTPIGQPIVGTATLVFVVMLITGLILWWPRNKAALKARLNVSWRSKWKRLNWDLHSVPGFYAMLLALLIALTGLVWAFHWFEDATYFIATGGASHPEYPKVTSDTTKSALAPPLDRVHAAMRARHPDFETMALTVPEKPHQPMTAYVRFDPHAGFRYAWLQLDRFTGEELSSERFEDLNRGEKLRTLNYDLHTGSLLGVPGKALAFLASLVCATLPVTGFLIWWGRRTRSASR